MQVSALVLAAGRGVRIKSRVSKPLIKIKTLPLIVYSLKKLSRHPYIKEIIVVANRENFTAMRRAIKKYRIPRVKDVVLGGRLRQDSVKKGLAIVDRKSKMILVHDAVRPFISRGIISATIKAAKKHGAAITAVPLKATVKEATVDNTVKKTLKRSSLWEVQTPQVFRRELLLKAFRRFSSAKVTDDASLVEKLGRPVKLVTGSYSNIKVTTPEDLVLAEAIAKRWNTA